MASAQVYNANPVIFAPSSTVGRRPKYTTVQSLWVNEDEILRSRREKGKSDDETWDPIDCNEIYDLIRYIYDPEYPNTLEELHVVSAPQITINDSHVIVEFTPTVPHCGMSTLIGLSIRVRLLRSLPSRFKVDILVKPGSHQSEHALNKQLNDKERVAAALENPALLETLEKSLKDARRKAGLSVPSSP